MKTYSEAFKKLKSDLLEACDARFRRLSELGWDELGYLNECHDEDLDEELRKTTFWISKHGFHSVDNMIDGIMWTLQDELGVDALSVMDGGLVRIDCWKSNEGYVLPIVHLVADLTAPGEFWAGACELAIPYADKCWEALSKSDRKYLESLDWNNLSEGDSRDIFRNCKYDVAITIAFDGTIAFRPLWEK